MKTSKTWIKHRKYEPSSLFPFEGDEAGFSEEYLCEHGIGHEKGVHGCDGCCSSDSFPLK